MLSPLRVLLTAMKLPQTRHCSGFVSRMRYVNRLKEDDASCVAALQNGLIFLFHRLSPLLQRTEKGTFRPAALISSDVQSILERLGSDGSLLKESVLIGCTEQNQAQFCLDVGELDQAAVEEECEGNFVDLRKSFFLLTGAEAPLVAKGQALLRWHQTSRFCSATGQPTQRNQAGSQRVCSSGGTVYYPKMSPVVIVLVSDGKRCLLGRQSSFPRGMYSALAGFCDMGESLEETLCREVAEEVGLEVQSISYSSSQNWPFPHSSLMLGCHASVSPAHTQLKVDRAELEDARWFSLEEITSALQVKTPPRRGDPPVLWLPPKHAIANRLITEWTERQRGRRATSKL
ncbi:nucleoside diphosphate-linked moiety X motif 13 [Xiphias gladius]|uniref:nucleoside diphosphate-linked moiety X motif 13 n=1 Tax=Xiphias gladius TaxID=8245 RepID=UPI001A992B9D|nr:nucleoside diphosphate-linked moiety X motif 13 [Xiphias gladius]XP_039990299.1 nucleoside diphosphate-linked moiety X motif 13 [Xiphias gladius]XP_039990300.1 nucleoside diphosphate-linked moiety X motif 13 [Xiphias gladius]XP_039990301.1 nucleoside diphosphate-linked moiety X motif 13 [Xiphias gladius]